MAFMNSIGNCASIWTPYTYYDSSSPHFRPALGVVIALMCLGGTAGTVLRFYLVRQNKRLERMEGADSELRERDIRKLQKTAELEGIDIATARKLQKGFRFVI